MRNYQTELDRIIENLPKGGARKSVLLHSCCGPCSTYCLEYLARHFDVTVYYCNPNIEPAGEYFHRLSEQERVVTELPFASGVKLVKGDYDPETYLEFVKGLENEKEGGARCELCFELRLERTARLAKEKGFDYFGTTLTVSPHKNAETVNAVGERCAEKYGVKFLPSDFKKKNGYLRSIVLSKEYGIYRQEYCGCRFSLNKGEENV